MNVGSKTVVGALSGVCVLSLPAGIEGVPPHITIMTSQVVDPTCSDQVGLVHLSGLSAEEQMESHCLLQKYASVFSSNDTDLGCINLISHEIPLLDDTPIQQGNWRTLPSEYKVVKENISQLLDAQVIRESNSPFSPTIVLGKKKMVVSVYAWTTDNLTEGER